MNLFEKDNTFKSSAQRLNERITKWDNEKILFYGAGEHSRELLNEICPGKNNFIGFADRSEQRQKTGLLGFPVYAPGNIKKTGASKIVISSFSFQDSIYKELIKMEMTGIEIIKLYTEQDTLNSIKKRYAYHPQKNFHSVRNLKPSNTYILPIDKDDSPRVLLIHPPFPLANHRHKKVLPMNLLYIAAYAMKKNPNAVIRILDGQTHNLAINDMQYLITLEKWDIIGIGYWTAQEPAVRELSRFIRDKTESLLIHGGAHPTLCPEDAAPFCDLVVMNEGERTFAEIVRLFPERDTIFKIPGITYGDKNGLAINPPEPLINNLDDIPFPAFSLIPDLKIYDAPMHVTGGARMPLIGSRGCPFACAFCSSPLLWNKKVRWRSPAGIIDEMEEVIGTFNITQFHFWDDNIMLNPDYVKEICEEILQKGLTVHWCGLTRATHINKHKKLLPLMKKAGCIGIEIGIESFTEDSADLTRKEEGTPEIMEAGRNMEKAGIAPLYTHMLFNPGEKITGYTQKQRFLNEIDKKNTAYLADSRLGQASTPHRKTAFEQQAGELGKVYVTGHSSYVHHRINFIPYSLLNDVPVKTAQEQENPLPFLEIILQAIVDWDEAMIDRYLKTYGMVWEKIDGGKNVGQLCEEIQKEMCFDEYRSYIFVCLAIVGMARAGNVKSV